MKKSDWEEMFGD